MAEVVIEEKRRAPRKQIVLETTMTREGEVIWFSRDLEIHTLNLSRTGALITAVELLVPDEHCVIRLSKPGGGYSDLPVRVVWGLRNDEGIYCVGVEFRNLSRQEQELVDLALARGAR